MTYRKQFLLSSLFLLTALLLSLVFHPNADGWRAQLGFGVAVAETRERSGRSGFGGAPLVLTETVTRATLVQRLAAVGSGESLQSVDLTSEVSGRVVEIYFAVGDRVAVGEEILKLDDRVEQIALARAQLNFADASARLARVQRVAAAASASEAELRDATSALRLADLQRQEAELALARRVIVAPFTGILSLFTAQKGHWVTPQTVVARIDDRSRLRVSFLVPERFLSSVALDQTVTILTSAFDSPSMTGIVTELGGRLDTATRTLPVFADVDNIDDVLRPGMSFSLTLEFMGNDYFALNPLAIQWNMTGPYVWALDEEKRVTQVPIRIIQRRAEDVLVAGHLMPSQAVVIEGVQALRPGIVVTTELSGRRS